MKALTCRLGCVRKVDTITDLPNGRLHLLLRRVDQNRAGYCRSIAFVNVQNCFAICKKLSDRSKGGFEPSGIMLHVTRSLPALQADFHIPSLDVAPLLSAGHSFLNP